MTVQDWLSGADEAISADPDFLDWIGDATLAEVWSDCPWADRMIWLAAYNSGWPGWPSDADVVKVTCWCARRAQKYWQDKTNTAPMDAIEATEQWTKNPCSETTKAVEAAAGAAGAAAWAVRAAWAAAEAAVSAMWTARAVKNPPYAAPRAVDSAIAAAPDAERKTEHKIMCDYIRQNLKIGKMEGK